VKRIMSLIVKSLVTFLLGCGSLAKPLQAQTDLAMTASIPFAFTAGTQIIPPGTCQFSFVSSRFLLRMADVEMGHKKLFPVHPEQQAPGRAARASHLPP